jgi:HPt (histidine-containing phosphotransfer) domain-containing protein
MPVVCNFERLRDISMGDDEFAGELVRIFLDDTAVQIERLRAAVESADCNEAAEAAHRMKGAGGNVGAEIFAAACGEIETAGRTGRADALCGGLAGAQRELARARELFESELGVR